SMVAMAAMTAVTMAAVLMALRHGQPIAIFGLLGGMITPALLSVPEPQASLLFSYLFVLYGFMLFILARRGWWVLAAVGLMALFGWSGLWYCTHFVAGDGIILLMFSMGVVAAVMGATARYGADDGAARGLNILALVGASVMLFLLHFKMTLGLFDWGMMGVLTLALLVLTWAQPYIYRRALWAKFLADLVLLVLWSYQAPLADMLVVLGGLAVIYSILPFFIMRRVEDPRFWAVLQSVAAVVLYLLAYLRLEIDTLSLWGAAALALAAVSITLAGYVRKNYRADDEVQEHLVATYAVAASAFMAMGLAIILPGAYLPLAFAIQAAVTMGLAGRFDIPVLRIFVLLLAAAFIALNLEAITDIVVLMNDSLVDKPRMHIVAPAHYMLQLGVPSALFGLTLYFYRKQGGEGPLLSHMLKGLTMLTGVVAAYYAARQLMGMDDNAAGFMQRGMITMAFGAGALALMRAPHVWRFWGMVLLNIAILRVVYFDMLLLNPYFDRTQHVGDVVLFNGVTMTYGLGLGLCLFAAYSFAPMRKLYGLLAAGMLFTLVTLTVRQAMHGDVLARGDMSPTEFYGYSVVWLATGLALLVGGIMKDHAAARLAALGFILLSIVKVFIFDAAGLDDLYRVFSFMGLGVSLIGLSVFYTRFASGKKDSGL
ncbi:MAG: DUF2339 domain-containing protein, partial [Alphaproteobacteria bacterium]|nr:DUF2339 domain-containing protein [Alphaproteobacteria bacterium]